MYLDYEIEKKEIYMIVQSYSQRETRLIINAATYVWAEMWSNVLTRSM